MNCIELESAHGTIREPHKREFEVDDSDAGVGAALHYNDVQKTGS